MRPDDWYIYYDKSSFVGCNPVELGKAAADRIERDGKQLSYLQQENEVLIERVRKLEAEAAEMLVALENADMLYSRYGIVSEKAVDGMTPGTWIGQVRDILRKKGLLA